MKQELLRESYCTQRQAEHLANVPFFGNCDFATATAKIKHEHVSIVDTSVGEHAQVDESAFLQAGDDVDFPSDGGFYPLKECAGVF